MSKIFSYVITIYNQEDVLDQVLNGVLSVAGRNAIVVPVLDDCTDQSEAIVDHWIRQSDRDIRKIHTPNVHEILSINAGIEASLDADFHVILQGDVVLKDRSWEEKTTDVYAQHGNLGYLSYRLGANLRKGRWRELGIVQEEPVESVFGHGLGVEYSPTEILTYRMAVIKSPVCIPRFLRDKIGIMDAHLAPYGWDDHEYSLRCLQAGFYNAIYPLNFESRIEWGGTRKYKSPMNKRMRYFWKRNTTYIAKKYGRFLTEYKFPPIFKAHYFEGDGE